MQVYFCIPYAKILFYLFTIVFHALLLVKVAVSFRYLLAVLLLIPVIAVSLGLLRFAGKTVIGVSLNNKVVELKTLFRTMRYAVDEISIEGHSIRTGDGRNYTISPAGAEALSETLKSSL